LFNRDVYELWGFEKYIYNTITGVEHRTRESALIVSPNPFETKIRIHFNEYTSGQAKIVLLDATGRLVWKSSQIDFSFQNELEIDSFALSSGIYICILYLNDKLTSFTSRLS
jgi:hypothetical protein